MPDFPSFPTLGDLHTYGLSVFSGCGVTQGLNRDNASGAAWPEAARALFIPVRVPTGITVYKMVCGTGTGTTGNFDLGIYDAGGNKIVSTGSTAKTTASSERVVDITDTFLGPGLYYLAMAVDDTGPYIARSPSLSVAKLWSIYQMATAFPLPTVATFASVAVGYFPAISAYLRPE